MPIWNVTATSRPYISWILGKCLIPAFFAPSFLAGCQFITGTMSAASLGQQNTDNTRNPESPKTDGPVQELSFTMDADGKTTVAFKKQNIITDAAIWVGADFADGKSLAGEPETRSVDLDTHTITILYPSAYFIIHYELEVNRLRIQAEVTNISDRKMLGWTIGPGNNVFPGPPTNTCNGCPLFNYGVDGPNYATYKWASTSGRGTATIANESQDSARLLMLGWDHSAQGDTCGECRNLRISTRNKDNNQGRPLYDHPIEPGFVDNMDLTYRFGGEENPKDLLAAYAKGRPDIVQWTDRRPILTLFLRVSEPTTGLVLPDPNSVINQLKAGNYQGVLVWDLEGYPSNGEAYVGDPRVMDDASFNTGNPQVKTQADNFFKTITNAGYRVGGTLRWAITRMKNGQPVHEDADRDTLAQNMVDIATYTYNKWGWTLFYVDSTSSFEGDAFRKVQEGFPQGLFFPENVSVAHYGVSAPYRESRIGGSGIESLLPQLALAQLIWPDSFCLFKTDDESPERLQQFHAQYVELVRKGNILLSRDASFVKAIYTEAGK